MIEEEGVVREVEGEYARVETIRKTSCGSCNVKGTCGTSLIASVFPQRTALLKVANPEGAKIGDRVVLGLDESLLQRTSVLVYGLPMLTFIGGSVLGHYIFATELMSILGGLSGLLAGLFVVRLRTANVRKLTQSEARILRKQSISVGFVTSNK